MTIPETPPSPPAATAPDLFDITFLGGGPTGLFGAFYAGLRGMKTKIIDALDQLGGQLSVLYPEKYILDVPGFPRVTARDLVDRLVVQMQAYHPTVCLRQTVQTLTRDETRDAWLLQTDQQTHLTRTLVLCAGAGAFSPKKLPLPEAAQFEERGLYYHVPSKATFQGKRLLIVGGGDSALDWALNLQDTAADITLIHRRNQFRAHEDTVRQVLASRTHVLTFHELAALEADDGHLLRGAVLENNQTHARTPLAVNAVLVQVGFMSSLGPLRNWPVKTQGSAIVVDSMMRTNLPGIFAAGDVASYPGKLKLIVTGFGEVTLAANAAKTLVDPAAKLFPGHSTELADNQPLTTVG
jgi:thioredoxin reductase (NADPH)